MKVSCEVNEYIHDLLYWINNFLTSNIVDLPLEFK